MSAGAVVMMILGMLIIWGGLASSIVYARKKAKES
ncbi:methionine/alanine import family NSS transporter small subunit [Allobacillus sp. GCM10007491]|uniref:Methionine/alanine import family NSS transporter small subunit n=2 Tax=Allobacillus TaxID=1400133 RepID=A0A941CTC6_9BACI|nr:MULTISPECIES: methionine/alanine import family NSS transporter small subunit [Allobacillus]MBR7553562.1 methionine/alanine import family NSS transporter small subunit [Allobacillus saliphilus]TSJ61900.1 methionine/alanine import family NSS transporter small subunit [Allobacillus salarius]